MAQRRLGVEVGRAFVGEHELRPVAMFEAGDGEVLGPGHQHIGAVLAPSVRDFLQVVGGLPPLFGEQRNEMGFTLVGVAGAADERRRPVVGRDRGPRCAKFVYYSHSTFARSRACAFSVASPR